MNMILDHSQQATSRWVIRLKQRLGCAESMYTICSSHPSPDSYASVSISHTLVTSPREYSPRNGPRSSSKRRHSENPELSRGQAQNMHTFSVSETGQKKMARTDSRCHLAASAGELAVSEDLALSVSLSLKDGLDSQLYLAVTLRVFVVDKDPALSA